jgi:hypothetical protein
VDILAGNIVWINRPYAAGKYPDIKIFRSGLAHFLDEYERVEADDGYIGEAPQKVKCPGCASNPTENQEMQNRVRSRHESLNGRLKNWEILKSMYRHDIMEHGNVFWAVAVITQISINVTCKIMNEIRIFYSILYSADLSYEKKRPLNNISISRINCSHA